MKNNGNYYTIVIEDTNVRRVVAAGTIFMEQKFIRGCGVVS
jgi:glucosamine-phosphate N-acetyltransferase